MPHIEFTSQLAQHVDCPPGRSVDASSLREALEVVFSDHPQLRTYVMDDQGVIRKHIAVFINGEMLHRRDQLDVEVGSDGEIFVMQALSGG
jgi:molybdopterin synthase sulfur carrier subunit